MRWSEVRPGLPGGKTIRGKLVTGFAVVALLGVLALAINFVSHGTVRSSNARITEHSIPLEDAAREMEIAALTTSLSVLRYVEQGDRSSLRTAATAPGAYRRALADARRLAAPGRERDATATAAARFARLERLGRTMIARRTGRDAVFARLLDRLDRFEDELDEGLATWSDGRVPFVLLELQTDVQWLVGQLSAYASGGDEENREETLESADELREELDELRAAATTPGQRRFAAAAAATHAAAVAETREVILSEERLRHERARFGVMQARVLATLNDELQPLAAAARDDDQRRAESASTRAQVLSALNLGLLILVTLTALLVLLRSIMRPIRALIRGARIVAGGDLDHRVDGLRDDELGHLAGAFNRMVERLQTTLVSKERLELSEALLSEQATTDALTGLANRVLLLDRIEQALRRGRRRGERAGLLFLDLDDFKAINDAYGHNVGDRVLLGVASRLRGVVREEDTIARADPARCGGRRSETVARLGGDEFVVLLEGVCDDEALRIADRILATLRAPLAVGGQRFFLDASIGVVVSSGDHANATDLLRDGDTAMYEAKHGGKGRARRFDPSMRQRALARSELVRDLRDAVAGDQLRLLFQPQVALATGTMTGVEALVRWQHPERGLLGPHEFIGAAEQTGEIVSIDDWVLREACRQLRRWDAAGLAGQQVAVNVSARRLVAGDLPETVAAVLAETGVAPERLELELTETVAVEHDDAAVKALTAVRALGVRVAIDDFGMGHSALSRLQSFPVDRLKIDRSFVAPLSPGNERGSIADAMIAMGQSLGLEVLAEGIETQEHLDALLALGCPAAQGYLFSRPVDACEIERLGRQGTPLGPVRAPVAPLPDAVAPDSDRLVRNLLAELQRLTGLESTYLTSIDWAAALQHITHARNTAALEIPEGMSVDWGDTVCRRALEQGVTYTDDVAATLPGSSAAEELGLQTYLSVPVVDGGGEVVGTLCGASTRRVPLGEDAIVLMRRFAQLIAQGVAVTASAGAPR